MYETAVYRLLHIKNSKYLKKVMTQQ